MRRAFTFLLVAAFYSPAHAEVISMRNFCVDRKYMGGADIACHLGGGFERRETIKPETPLYLGKPDSAWIDDKGLHLMIGSCEYICLR